MTAVFACAAFGTAPLLHRSPPPLTSPADGAAFLSPIPGEALSANPQAPLTVRQVRRNHVPLMLVIGGSVGTRRSARRCDVRRIVAASGAQAGLNGTYFADASLRGTDNLLIGPSLCGNEARATLGPYDRSLALVGRPLVLISSTHTRIVPYDPGLMDTEDGLHRLLPNLSDVFLGGPWLVHGGIAAAPQDIAVYHQRDAEDYRRRAFFAMEPDGRPCLGATLGVASSTELALALQEAGFREAILLDSGFSTSLVVGKKILVTGHTAMGIPSRPVPHALVLFGTKFAPTALFPHRRA